MINDQCSFEKNGTKQEDLKIQNPASGIQDQGSSIQNPVSSGTHHSTTPPLHHSNSSMTLREMIAAAGIEAVETIDKQLTAARFGSLTAVHNEMIVQALGKHMRLVEGIDDSGNL